jgi:hypothetical protein
MKIHLDITPLIELLKFLEGTMILVIALYITIIVWDRYEYKFIEYIHRIGDRINAGNRVIKKLINLSPLLLLLLLNLLLTQISHTIQTTNIKITKNGR